MISYVIMKDTITLNLNIAIQRVSNSSPLTEF